MALNQASSVFRLQALKRFNTFILIASASLLFLRFVLNEIWPLMEYVRPIPVSLGTLFLALAIDWMIRKNHVQVAIHTAFWGYFCVTAYLCLSSPLETMVIGYWLILTLLANLLFSERPTRKIYARISIGALFVSLFIDFYEVFPIVYDFSKSLIHKYAALNVICITVFATIFTKAIIRAYAKEFKRSQELEILNQKNDIETKMREDFFHSISHDLRSPLSAISGTLQILNERYPDDGKLIEAGISSVDILTRLINDILDSKKISEGKMQLIEDWIIPSKLVGTLSQLYIANCRERGVKFFTNTSSNLNIEVKCDEVRLAQILNNLLSNAVKFTHHGYISLTSDYEENQLIITVLDTGIGMNTAGVSSLFDPYTQASAAISKAYGGTGLGMTITQQLVQLMGGSITVNSAQGIGTTVTVKIPMSSREIPCIEQQSAASDSLKLSKFKLLIVEDDKVNQMVLMQILRQYFSCVDIANDGAEALRMMLNDTYHLVITDIMMPNMDGTALIKEMQKSFPNIPVIALTGVDLPEERQHLETLGFKHIIRKPFQPQAVLGAARECLG